MSNLKILLNEVSDRSKFYLFIFFNDVTAEYQIKFLGWIYLKEAPTLHQNHFAVEIISSNIINFKMTLIPLFNRRHDRFVDCSWYPVITSSLLPPSGDLVGGQDVNCGILLILFFLNLKFLLMNPVVCPRWHKDFVKWTLEYCSFF